MVNRITWETVGSQPFLNVDVKLNISLEVILSLFPQNVLCLFSCQISCDRCRKISQKEKATLFYFITLAVLIFLLRISPGQSQSECCKCYSSFLVLTASLANNMITDGVDMGNGKSQIYDLSSMGLTLVLWV